MLLDRLRAAIRFDGGGRTAAWVLATAMLLDRLRAADRFDGGSGNNSRLRCFHFSLGVGAT
jgi:hypothetical protein